jgi:hypothetical protein
MCSYLLSDLLKNTDFWKQKRFDSF